MKLVSSSLHALLKRLIWWMVKSLVSTYRFHYEGLEHLKLAESLHPKGAHLLALWHEDALIILSGMAGRPYLAMASRSKDGDYAAFIAEKFGFTLVRGSSRKRNRDKGGKEAMLEYIQQMSLGMSGGITVDGPKGPRHECKPGIVVIAKETGAAIVPIVARPHRFWELNSWDRFKIPKPFSKILIQYLPPVIVPHEATTEEVSLYCKKVRDRLCGEN